MTKVNLTDVANLNNQSSAVTTLKNNNDTIETAFDNTLSRDGTSPNEMNSSLDMNNNRILNLPVPISDNEAARLLDVQNIAAYEYAGLQTQVNQYLKTIVKGDKGDPGAPGGELVVQFYGALDDNLTDNTSSVQNAVNHAVALGRSLYFPSTTTGIYRIGNINWFDVDIVLDRGVVFKNTTGGAFVGNFANNVAITFQVTPGDTGVNGEAGSRILTPSTISTFSNSLKPQGTPGFSSNKWYTGQANAPTIYPYTNAGSNYVAFQQYGSDSITASGSVGLYGGNMNVINASNGPPINITGTLTNNYGYITNVNDVTGIFYPAKITSSVAGIPVNTGVVPGGVLGTIVISSIFTGTTTFNAPLVVNGVTILGTLTNGSNIIGLVNTVAPATAGSVITSTVSGLPSGTTVVSSKMDTIKMSAAFTGTSTTNASIQVVVSRTELNVFTVGLNFNKAVNQPGLSIYNDINISSNYSTNPADQEGNLVGLNVNTAKYVPGNVIDYLHEGSHGISVMTYPGYTGYDFNNRVGDYTYPQNTGVRIVGYSGQIGTVTSGEQPAATPGFLYGVHLGGLGAGPFYSVDARSNFSIGIQIEDYTNIGLRFVNRLNTTADAIHVEQTGGNVKIDTTLFLGGVFNLPSFANDSAAAAAGIQLGAIYRNGSQLMIRMS